MTSTGVNVITTSHWRQLDVLDFRYTSGGENNEGEENWRLFLAHWLLWASKGVPLLDFKQFGQYAHIDRQVDVKRDQHTAWLDW